MEYLIQFFGRLHPLMVHLPIGILVLAVVLHFLSNLPRFAALRILMPVLWLAGAVTAVLACIAGFLLKISGGYDEGAVDSHQYAGLALAVITVMVFLTHYRNKFKRLQTPAVLVLLILLTVTGHYGGNLTHGEEYLTQPIYALIGQTPGKVVRQPIVNINQALVFQDLIEPVLEKKCYQCHSTKKQKGDLRLDTEEFILKGGEHGEIISAGNADKSKLYQSLVLPEEDDDRMPPKGKPQLTEVEIQIIRWWITQGHADFTKKVADVDKDEEVKTILASYVTGETQPVNQEQASEIPTGKVNPVNVAIRNNLEAKGIALTSLTPEHTYLAANLGNSPDFTDADLAMLLPLKDQILWLDLSGTKITDKASKAISQFKNLTRLSLDNTLVTDKGLAPLKNLKMLRYLNLYGTAVTDPGIKSLAALPNLQTLYLWQTQVTAKGVAALQQAKGQNLEINFGNIPETEPATAL